MASFDDDQDPPEDEFDNEDEDMEDADQDQEQDDADQGQEDDGGDEEEDEDNEGDDNDDDDDEEDNPPESPSQRPRQQAARRSASRDQAPNPSVVLTSPSPRGSGARSPFGPSSWIPSVRPEAVTAQVYDIVPTMAAPQSTSINAVAATPDMRWVFTGGADGYVRMFNWVETANGKVPLTVAQKHPFVDSVMKAGSLLTYWENEETTMRTPPSQTDEGKWLSPVYSLAVQHEAIWLLSGLESGGINLQTCRHQAGTRITTLREHTSAVSVLSLSQDETSLLSGSWDKNIHDWDLNTGKVRRSFRGSASQVSAIEVRPMSDVPIPEVVEDFSEPLFGTFSSNNANRPTANGSLPNGDSKGGDEDAMGSPAGSLFGEGDHGSLFGEDTGPVGGGNAFGDDDDELTRALADGLQEPDAPGEQDTEMTGIAEGGPVQPPAPAEPSALDGAADLPNGQPPPEPQSEASQPQPDQSSSSDAVMNGMSHSDGPLTAPPTNDSSSNGKPPSASDLLPQSESTFLDTSIDGTLRIWDRRMPSPIATIAPYGSTPPWSTGACWSPDGNFFYVGRRNCAVDEYSIHKLGSSRGKPERVFRFQQGSGPVYAVRSMPNSRHLVW